MPCTTDGWPSPLLSAIRIYTAADYLMVESLKTTTMEKVIGILNAKLSDDDKADLLQSIKIIWTSNAADDEGLKSLVLRFCFLNHSSHPQSDEILKLLEVDDPTGLWKLPRIFQEWQAQDTGAHKNTVSDDARFSQILRTAAKCNSEEAVMKLANTLNRCTSCYGSKTKVNADRCHYYVDVWECVECGACFTASRRRALPVPKSTKP